MEGPNAKTRQRRAGGLGLSSEPLEITALISQTSRLSTLKPLNPKLPKPEAPSQLNLKPQAPNYHVRLLWAVRAILDSP